MVGLGHQNHSSLAHFILLLREALRGRESKEGMLLQWSHCYSTTRLCQMSALSPKVTQYAATHRSSSELWFWWSRPARCYEYIFFSIQTPSNTAAEHEIKLQMNTRNMCDILRCSLYKLDSGVPLLLLLLFKFINSWWGFSNLLFQIETCQMRPKMAIWFLNFMAATMIFEIFYPSSFYVSYMYFFSWTNSENSP